MASPHVDVVVAPSAVLPGKKRLILRPPALSASKVRLLKRRDERAAGVAGRVRLSLRRAGAVESCAWAGVWFALGAASASAGSGVWLLLAFLFWVTSVAFARKRTRIARRLVAVDGVDVGTRESLRAQEALGGVVEALRDLVTWGEATSGFVKRATEPPPVDPEIPIPPNPLPRDASLTPLPGKLRPRYEAPPPSHPSLMREPDHDPRTCKVCLNTSEPPPFGPGSLRDLPPYAESFVPATPQPFPDSEEGSGSVDVEMGPDSRPWGKG